jgi:ABC-type amino acid transport system permease subunit
MDVAKAKSDLGTVADLLAVLTAVAALGIWLRQGDHWRVALVSLGVVGWCFLLASASHAFWKAKIYWSYDWAYNHFAVSAIAGGVIVLLCIIVTAIIGVLAGVPLAMTTVGLLLALAAGTIGALALVRRYRRTRQPR